MVRRSLFGRGRALEHKIDELLDRVLEVALVLEATVTTATSAGAKDAADARFGQVLEIKRASNTLRREIEAELYTQMLIPDLLGDVTDLIESLHRLVEQMHHGMRFSRYAPFMAPELIHQDTCELGAAVTRCVDALVQGARAFFRDFTRVREYVHKVSFFESECDAITDRILQKLYASDIDLARANHVASGIRELDGIADAAERLADALTIYAIKRAE
jgi:predicted phosphate transport protein (TIGR00153 family)